MPTFPSKPIARKGKTDQSIIGQLTPKVRRHPVLLFGVPFVLTIVAGSFGLSYLTQTRYDYNATKVQTVSKQDELGMRKDRRKVDIREEYFVSNYHWHLDGLCVFKFLLFFFFASFLTCSIPLFTCLLFLANLIITYSKT